eukprot:5373626-Pleurochrysis_carterae.AAC.7
MASWWPQCPVCRPFLRQIAACIVSLLGGPKEVVIASKIFRLIADLVFCCIVGYAPVPVPRTENRPCVHPRCTRYAKDRYTLALMRM